MTLTTLRPDDDDDVDVEYDYGDDNSDNDNAIDKNDDDDDNDDVKSTGEMKSSWNNQVSGSLTYPVHLINHGCGRCAVGWNILVNFRLGHC